MRPFDVVQQPSDSLRGITKQTQGGVARAAQQSTHNGAVVAVVDMEVSFTRSGPLSRTGTGCAHTSLGLQQGVVVLDGEPVDTQDSVGPSVLGVPLTAVGSTSGSTLGSVLSLGRSLAHSTHKAPWASSETDLLLASEAPGRHGVRINLVQPGLGVDAPGARPSPSSCPVCLDGDLAAPAALSTPVAQVDLGQDVTIFPFSGGMAPDVTDRTSLDPTTLRGGLGGNAGTTSAPAVTAAVGNSACGAASTQDIISHRKDCITCCV
jgi:hypothetical protein